MCADSAVVYGEGCNSNIIPPGRKFIKDKFGLGKNPEGIVFFAVGYAVAVKGTNAFSYIVLNHFGGMGNSQLYRRIKKSGRDFTLG
jgi:hypothetical protein